MRWLDSFTDSEYMNLSKLWETVKDIGAWGAAVHGEVTREQTLFWLHENTAAVAGLPLKWAKMGEKENK